MRGLDIGPRDVPIEGFDTLDCDMTWQPGMCAVWGGEDPLPIVSETYDVVYASHVLQFIPWQRTVAALEEALRILKTGGEIEIWVPDFDYIIDCVECKKSPEPNEYDNRWEWALSKLCGGGQDGQWHKASFGFGQLEVCLERAGFKHIKRKEVPLGVRHGRISLGVTAVKLLGD